MVSPVAKAMNRRLTHILFKPITGEVTIESGASKMKLTPSGEITIEGVQIKIKGSGPLAVEGATITSRSPLTFRVSKAGAPTPWK